MRIASIAIRTLTFSTVVVSLTEGTLAANARFRANVCKGFSVKLRFRLEKN